LFDISNLPTSFRDALFEYYQLSQGDKSVSLDRLIFETIFMSVKTLRNQPPTKFRELPRQLSGMPSGTTTVDEELDRIKAAGCDEQLV
jgi:hypothetical protein